MSSTVKVIHTQNKETQRLRPKNPELKVLVAHKRRSDCKARKGGEERGGDGSVS